MVTAGTYRKFPYFASGPLLSHLQERLFELAVRYETRLQAWAIFPNHYHWIGALECPGNLRRFVQHFHSASARELNRRLSTPGRQIWFQYWDSQIRRQRSFFSRLDYVHANAVHHGIVREASRYPWCSAGWFQRAADLSFFSTVMNFPTERLSVPDEFEATPLESLDGE
ncbi:MAG TPA: transposase [Candidatus Acidoferrum sp.]|nr:transposase [Candidatus Acidoferrum sp.]